MAEYANGEMVLNVSLVGSFYGKHASLARPHLTFDNFVLECDSRWSGGAVGGTYGVMFRYQGGDMQQDSSYYGIYIGNDGRYEVGKQVNYDWITLLEGFSDTIDRSGGVNRFHIEANGHNLRFFINGQLLSSLFDVDYDLGDIMLVAWKPNGAELFKASFDNLIVVRYP